ncbi:MAG TPA: DUF4242 domain-containing protein [Acidimicrobiales bacterium]|nr:DUF4242 domain-containing protein [Acidimicrobiales bacterium]
MPRYLVERTFDDRLEGQAAAAARWRRVVCSNARLEVTWLHSYVSADRHRMICLYEAPSPEAVRHAAAISQLPVGSITEVLVLDPFAYLPGDGTRSVAAATEDIQKETLE